MHSNLSIISTDDGTVLRSIALSGADLALEGLEWSHLLPLLNGDRSVTSFSDHAVLVGRPPGRPWDDHCAEHKQEECSRLVLVDLRTLALVGAGTEVAGRIVGVELLNSSPRSADILAYAEGPQTFARLALSLSPPNEQSVDVLPPAFAPVESGASSKVDALKEFFQRGSHKERSATDAGNARNGADEHAGLASWSGKTLPIAEDSVRIDLGQARGIRVLGRAGGLERAAVWGDFGLEVSTGPLQRNCRQTEHHSSTLAGF